MQYSIVNLSQVKENDWRLDGEYWLPEYIKSLTKINELNHISFKDSVESVGGNAFDGEKIEVENGIPCARITEINQNIEIDNWAKLDYEEYNKFSIKELQNNDILFCGTHHNAWDIGRVLIVNNPQKQITWNQRVFRFRSKIENLNQQFFYIFLQTKFARHQIEREARGNNQLNLNNTELEKLQIPLLSTPFQTTIANLVQRAFELQQSSQTLYKEAETLLLEELGLLDWKPKHQLWCVKNHSDTVKANRFDAEYFQPKYEEVLGMIKEYKGGFGTLQNIVNIEDKNFNPDEKTEYRYIELSNISSNGEIKDFTIANGSELPTRARRRVKQGDLILSSIEGSLESIALITENYDNILCSTGFYALNSNEINIETLLIFFKSIAGQLQLKKGCSGTILTAISKDELNQITIPKIKKDIQNLIQKKIREMYNSKEKSKSLLETAKKAVEMAIEENEEVAMRFIKNNIE